MQTADQYRDEVIAYLRQQLADAESYAAGYRRVDSPAHEGLAATWEARAAALRDAIKRLPIVGAADEMRTYVEAGMGTSDCLIT